MKKLLPLVLMLIFAYSAVADNDELYEWKKTNVFRAAAKTDIYGETINFGEILQSGKCILMEVSRYDDRLSWRRHLSGTLEYLQQRLSDQLYVIWVENRDNIPLEYLRFNPVEGAMRLANQQGDWTKGVDNTPVNYHIINGHTLNDDDGIYFFSPAGYRCRVTLGEGEDAVLQIMKLIANYPRAGQIADIKIMGPKRVSVGNPEQYTTQITCDVPTNGIEWNVPYATLSCSDCGNPRITFSRYGGRIEAIVKTSYGITRQTYNVDIRSEWEDNLDATSYCMDDEYQGETGGSAFEEYGIRISHAKSNDNRKGLYAVEHYITTPGEYTLNVYSGDYETPGTLIHTQTFNIEETGWQTLRLTNTLPVNEHDYFWITFTTNAEIETATYSEYCGTPYGSMYRTGSRWYSYHDRSWMIKAVRGWVPSPSLNTFDISGPTSGITGRTYTFHAEGPDNTSYTWAIPTATPTEATGTDVEVTWDRPGTFNVYCTAIINSRQVTKDTTIEIIECPELLSVPMSESFEGAYCQCWTTHDHDGDGSTWVVPQNTADASEGTNVAASASRSTSGDLVPNNWLISPRIHIPSGGADLSWWDYSPNDTRFVERYRVLVSTTGTNPDDFTGEIYRDELTEGQQWTKRIAGLYNFAGQDVYIAFVHSLTVGQDHLYIDNISIMGAECYNIDLPYEEKFENKDFTYCWRFVDADGDHMEWAPSSTFYSGPIGHDSKYCAASASWRDEALTPDNWLITPSITLPEQAAKLEWWEQARDLEDYAEHYSVLLSTTGNSIDNFEHILYEGTINEPRTWRQRMVSLAEFAGQTVFVAFRHYNCTDNFLLLIDNVKISVIDDNGIGDIADIPVAIYPNPTTGKIQVRADNLQRIDLLDPAGRMLQTIEHRGALSSCEMDIAPCPAGLYFLRITTAQGVTIKRVTKQ